MYPLSAKRKSATEIERESQIPLPRFLQVDELQARTVTSVHQLKPHF